MFYFSFTHCSPHRLIFVFKFDADLLISRTYPSSNLSGKKIESSLDVAAYLLENALVAVVPGEAFHLAGKLRLSYSSSMENLKNAMDRIESALTALK